MGGYSDLFYYKSPSLVGVVVKALEGREERQGLDFRRCLLQGPVVCVNCWDGSILGAL